MPSGKAEDFDDAIDFIYLACAIGCVLCAALAAGSFYLLVVSCAWEYNLNISLSHTTMCVSNK
jgi:hypothetical protein